MKGYQTSLIIAFIIKEATSQVIEQAIIIIEWAIIMVFAT